MTQTNVDNIGDSESISVLPSWFTDAVVTRFRAEISSVFLLHGDITCLVPNPNVGEESQQPYIPLHELLKRVFDERDMVIFYSISSGARFLTPDMKSKFRKVAELDKEDIDSGDSVAKAKAGLAAKRAIPQEPELCLSLIEKVLQKMDSVAVVIENVHFIAPELQGPALTLNERTTIERIRSWAQDSRVKQKTNIVILLTDLASKVSSEFRQSASRITSVFIPKPDANERKRYIVRLAYGTSEQQRIEGLSKELEDKLTRAKNAERGAINKKIEELDSQLQRFGKHFDVSDDFNIASFVGATQGMSLRQILEIFRQSKQSGRPIDLLYVRDKKREILNAEYGEVMEVIDPDWGLDDIGGLAHIKTYFQEIISAISRGESRAIPQGITLMGPPGTGKTALVEALARESRYNFVKMKNARSMWVGQSEERTERQIQGLWALAPVIVMNDEADLGGAQRDTYKGDSGVSERIERSWMQFLSDPRIRGKIIMINCTNRPDRMDAAMKRSGRSDDRLALLMPSQEERAAIFQVMFRKHVIPTSLYDFTAYAELTEGFSGADIQKIALESFRFAGRKNKNEVDNETLREAIADFISSASQADIDFMTLLAISEASSRRLLPQNTLDIVRQIQQRNLVPNCAELVAQLEVRKII